MNKKTRTLGKLFLLCLSLVIVTDFTYTNLKKRGACYKVYKKAKTYAQEKQLYARLKNHSPIAVSPETNWFDSSPYIAHACGGIDQRAYTNSYDALVYNYEKGHRVFEVDISVTQDGHAVLAHDWEHFSSISNIRGGVLLSEFLNAELYGKYKTMSLEQLIAFMRTHEDMYIVTDKLFDESSATTIVNQILKYSEQQKSILDRFIIQVYSEENFFIIDSIHHFKNYIYTTYCESEDRINKTALFCLENNIPVITMWHERAQRADISLFTSKGLHIYTHTVNTQEEVQQDKKLGVTNVYTDFLP